MQAIKASSLTQTVKDWLVNTRHPRILHVFDDACNLLNEHKDVLSIVSPQIGNSPFNLVIEDEILFSEHLSLDSPLFVSPNQLTLGNLIIHTTNVELWNPRPDWDELNRKREIALHQVCEIASSQTALLAMTGFTNYELPLLEFSNSLTSADISTAKKLTSKLAGFGQGLTPSGDDFIMGAMYAAWIIHPREVVSDLANEIVNTAIPLTTSLSAAWLRSAGRGEAGQVWHDLFNAFLSADKMAVEKSIGNILGVGHTSGADALTGYLDVFNSYAEKK